MDTEQHSRHLVAAVVGGGGIRSRARERTGNELRLLLHAIIVGLTALALLLARFSWPRTPALSVVPSLVPQQRLLVFRFGNPSPSHGAVGFLPRQIPARTIEAQREKVSIGGGASWLMTGELERVARSAESFGGRLGFVTRGIDPEGSLTPVARTEIITYTVRPGDTLWDIAAKFNISQDSLWANNDLASPDLLSVGDVLTVPPVDGLLYTVRPGDTLARIAQRYRADVEDIIAYAPNGLEPGEEPAVGQQIMIPGGVKPIPPRRTVSLTSAPPGALKGAGSFVMPVSGIITQGFRPGHPALDIAAPRGAPVYAADAGYVAFAGWHPWGYGYAVVIDHGNGFRTLYAHMSWYAPNPGDSVRRGQLVGGVGSTYGPGGFASGPHLHFELIQNGAKRNPCLFLPCP